MKNPTIKSYIIYSALLLTALTILLNYVAIPILSEFYTKYFNLFSAAVIILLGSIFTGISNKMDFSLLRDKNIFVSKTVFVILAIELFISLNFHFLDSIQDRVWGYAIALTPSFGFVISRPLLRLNYIEVKLEELENRKSK